MPKRPSAPLPRTDDDVVRWVNAAIAALDDEPRYRMWKTKALGMPRPVALAMAPRQTRVDISVPIGEWRVVKEIADRYGIPPRAYLRRALGTMMLVEGVAPEMVPWLIGEGLIDPR